jgi:MFS family permease
VLADISPLRAYPAFRRLWAGQTITAIGFQITATAVPLQVYDLTHSSFRVGLVSLVALVPLIAFGLFGGAVADAVDRRRLALATSGGLAAVSAALLLFALTGPTTAWPLFGLVAVQSALLAVDGPARRAIIPNLVPLRDMPAATALGQIGWNAAATTGPLIAGVSVAAGGYVLAYALDLITFAAALYGLGRLPAMPPTGGGRRAGAASVGEGLRFLGGQRVILMTFVVDVIAMVFGMPRALFPELAETQFGGGTTSAGFLYSAVAAGALLGAGLSGPLGRVNRQGLAVVAAIVVWGGAIAGFGLTHDVVVAVVLLAVAGAADMVSAVYRNSILNVATPDAMRGRLQGVFLVVVTGGPRLGDLEAGSVASLASPTFSVVSGGIASITAVLLAAAAVPALVRYDAREAIERAERPAVAGPEPPDRDEPPERPQTFAAPGNAQQ